MLGALMMAPVALWRIAVQDWSDMGWRGWLAIVHMSLGASVVGYIIWFWALRHLAASRLGVITYVQPVFGTFIAVYALHETFTGSLALAAALVLGGVALTQWLGRGPEAENESGEAAA